MSGRRSGIWSAFFELDTCRPVTGMGVHPIPWSVIRDYATEHGIRDVPQFVELIRALDRERMAKVTEGERDG